MVVFALVQPRVYERACTRRKTRALVHESIIPKIASPAIVRVTSGFCPPHRDNSSADL